MNKKGKGVLYYCYSCHREFPVPHFIAREMKMFNKKPFCPGCSKNDHTARYGEQTKRKGSLDDPPSQGQLEYIKGLGGNPKNVKTKGEAGEIINALKKEKEQKN